MKTSFTLLWYLNALSYRDYKITCVSMSFWMPSFKHLIQAASFDLSVFVAFSKQSLLAGLCFEIISFNFFERPLTHFILLCLLQTSCQCQKRRSQYCFWILSRLLLFIVNHAMLNTVLASAGYIFSNLWCTFICHAVICTTAFMLSWISSFQGKTHLFLPVYYSYWH